MIRRLAVVLGAIVMVAIGAVVFVVLPGGDDAAAPGGSNRLNALTSTSTSATYGLVLNGVAVGPVTPVKHGAWFADVVTMMTSGGTSKTVSKVKYEPLVLDVPLNDAASLYSWIASSMTATPPPPLTLGLANYGSTATQTEYVNATITRIETGTCDTAADAPATFRLSVVYTSSRSGPTPPGPVPPAKPAAHAGHCRLAIPNLDASKVTKMGPLAVAREVAGETRDTRGLITAYQFGPTTYSDLRVDYTDQSALTWTAWFNDLVVNGNVNNERSGTLGYWTVDNAREIGRLNLDRCGISRLARNSQPEAPVTMASSTLYCEALKYTSL